MAKFTELPVKMQLLTVFAVLLGLSLAAWWFIYKDMKTANDSAALEVKNKQAENERLKTYEPKLQDMRRQIATYKEQLENMKKIVPDEKLADQFIELMQATAATAGIEIRRYTARNTTSREFYTEAPYEMEVDGPYYSMLGFFERVGKLERIINVSSLKVANLKKGGDAGARHTYAYAPSESVVATCVTTTFFSKDNFTQPAAPAPPAKK